jgi:hypothetical protein
MAKDELVWRVSVRIFSEIIGHYSFVAKKIPTIFKWISIYDAQHRSNYHTTNEGLVRIQFKWLVPIDVFPEMKLRGLDISKTEL